MEPGTTLSHFTSSGKPLSPSNGYGRGNLHAPQGPRADRQGNAGVPNRKARSITECPGGGPGAAGSITTGGVYHAFAVAQLGMVWINNIRSVSVLTPDGKPALNTPITGGGMGGGKGIAVGSPGNAWAADLDTGSFTRDGKPRHTGGPLLSSPTSSGWSDKALQTLSGVVVNPSGNVWAADNYNFDANAPRPVVDPTGATIYSTVFVGIAAPVKAPLIGPPQKP